MSAANVPTSTLDVEQLKKRAKELKKQVAQGSVAAAWRVLRLFPDAASSTEQLGRNGIKLAQAQRVIAREAGFASWPRLRRALAIATLDPAAAENALATAALAGDDARADAILAVWPNLPANSAPCALALAAREAAAGFTEQTVQGEIGPNRWPPLLYLCSSRYRAGNPAIAAARVRLGEELLALGADANAGSREAETIRGYRTALGAAIGRAHNPQLAKRLLAAGADVADGPTLYEGSAMWEAVRLRDEDSLRALLAAKPPRWHVCHALPHALQFNDVDLTRLLLEHDGDPNWTMGTWGFDGNCLHEAVVLDNAPVMLEALLDHGAQVDFRDRDGRTPLALAVCLNRHALAALLRERGAKDDLVRDVDRWVSACFAGDSRTARKLAAAHPAQDEAMLRGSVASSDDRNAARAKLAARFVPADHVWLCRAIRSDVAAALPLLLAGGLDPNAVDDDGERSLHLAAKSGDLFATRCLLSEGADPKALNFAGETPLDCALRGNSASRDDLVAMLTEYRVVAGISFDDPQFAAVFDRAADAVVAGDIEGLRALLHDHPDLARARSSRPHRCTLLNYLGANGFEGERQQTPTNAVEVIELLIAAGSDPNAVCRTYRGGPAQNTVGLLTSSGHPREAGLTLAMVSALARGGARLDGVYALLARLFEAGWSSQSPGALADLDPASDLAGRTLVEAAMLGEVQLALNLLAADVDINARREDGATALHQAAFNGDAELVERLLSRGADASLRDNVFDGAAAGWACAGGHDELGKWLAGKAERPKRP